MNSNTLSDYIVIKKTTIFDVANVLTTYNKSSDDLKNKMMGAFPLTGKLGIFHFYLSTTPFNFLLPVRIKSFVAFSNNSVVGFAYLTKKFNKKEKILGIFVVDQYQGQGTGKKLLENILKGENEVTLNVLNDNENAIKLYRQFGFEIDNIVQTMKLKK